MKIIAKANLPTPARCALFTLQKQGLAFNFSPPGLLNGGESCLVCECPELNTLTSLKKDWRYDYYSLYGYPLPSTNYTCVPKVGLIELNRDKNSEMAHVVSETRTSYMSSLIKQLGHHHMIRKAYVGLHDILHEGKFITTRGEPLTCFEYQAWGPSEPRDRLDEEDCAMLDDKKQWRVTRCSEKLPYLCELWAGGDNPKDITTGLLYCSRIKDDGLFIFV
ncbi:hypothetical protein L9F63_018689 [Diploptera punctata]|uniref:C-type lectin domain-containing protein n=1 Tax=Diploptera punctata TaxID=6984 RepID=A0AAD8EFK3_DIPPU|nr:hypothetical protein L9F63_018689 [Diploptera punctata]